MRMSGTQLSVSQGGEAGVTALLDLSEASEVGEQEKTTTAAVFLSCVSASARTDERLTEEQSRSMHIEPTTRTQDVVRGEDVGNRVVQFGDEWERIRSRFTEDPDFQRFVGDAVRSSDSRRASESAFETFTAIADQVLEVGDSGVASGISYGRIATLFLLGYELCSAFIRRQGARLFLKFIGKILNFLIRYLKDIGFFDWLVRYSWGHITLDTVAYASGLGTGILLGAVIFGTITVAAIWYISRRAR